MNKKGLSWKNVIPSLIMIFVVLAIVLTGAIEPAEDLLGGGLNETGRRQSICSEYREHECDDNGPERCNELENEWEDDWGDIDEICPH